MEPGRAGSADEVMRVALTAKREPQGPFAGQTDHRVANRGKVSSLLQESVVFGMAADPPPRCGVVFHECQSPPVQSDAHRIDGFMLEHAFEP